MTIMSYAVINKHTKNADTVRLLETLHEVKQQCLMSMRVCPSNHSTVPHIST